MLYLTGTVGSFMEEIFTTLGNIVSSFASLVGNVFTSAVSLFYNSTDGLTVVGILTLIGVGTGLVIWGFKFIRSLIRIRTK